VIWNCTSCIRAPVATAAVGLLFERGASSGALAPIFAQLPDALHVNHPLSARFNPSRLLPADRAYHGYEGSLTTPPCTEGVHWIVLEDPITISGEDLAQFHESHSLQRAAGAAVLSLEAHRPFPACTDCAPCDVSNSASVNCDRIVLPVIRREECPCQSSRS
jgi:Eukaryotic-type carbonic anhydrase